MDNMSDSDIATAKINNHWKLFFQVYIFVTVPFIQINIINLIISYFPTFEDFRLNKPNKTFITVINFIIDYILTIPMVFLCFIFYESIGFYILFTIQLFLVHGLPFLCKEKNTVAFGHNPRRTITEIAPRKYKFFFLDNLISAIFLTVTTAILLCDMSYFPSSLSKTVKNGISTMDLGAGLILFTSGITARQARGIFDNTN